MQRRIGKLKAAQSAAFNIHQWSFTWNRALGVVLRRFFRMVCSMQVMSMRDMGMMSGLFVVSARMVLGCFLVITGGMFVVFRRFGVMFCTLLAHIGGLRVLREDSELMIRLAWLCH
jgi:hypothetical protein